MAEDGFAIQRDQILNLIQKFQDAQHKIVEARELARQASGIVAPANDPVYSPQAVVDMGPHLVSDYNIASQAHDDWLQVVIKKLQTTYDNYNLTEDQSRQAISHAAPHK